MKKFSQKHEKYGFWITIFVDFYEFLSFLYKEFQCRGYSKNFKDPLFVGRTKLDFQDKARKLTENFQNFKLMTIKLKNKRIFEGFY